ncbi:quinone oxidoreductase family protein [Phytopseudomonas daroniae]|uniref:quinone oxidoreductase family protein n=1 Tax=Phytopseudomonas daroniae TaxID=2487519 RepID=UPI0010383BBF|nr:quinone oxidoreductase [Pseudomonas daroniae]TBU77356.1 quinone oxidoreductase [Pseudomonas daroniae]
MIKAYGVICTAPGGPEVLKLSTYNLQPPGSEEIAVAIEAAGVNFIDLYRRSGALNDSLTFPKSIGFEGAGYIVSCGRAVTEFSVGDRVAFVDSSTGSYASHAILPAARAIKLADDLSTDLAAAAMFKGIAAEYLTFRCVPLGPGDWIVWHAAAGGVGSIATGWLAARGARVIGLASTPAKRAQALDAGCVAAFDAADPSTVLAIRELTQGKGVDVVFDSIGNATIELSLACLRQQGRLVLFGNSSGDVTGFNLSRLGQLGSLHVTRPTLKHYIGTKAELTNASIRVMTALASGEIPPLQVTRMPLVEAAQAHHLLQARKVRGSLILIPGSQ